MSRLTLHQVTKRFAVPAGAPVCAVDQLTLTVGEAECVAVLGPSGCGKTTTLRLVAGLETPDSGRIEIDGKPLADIPPKDRDVAMVFQSHALFPHLTARDNIAFGLMLRKFPRNEIRARVDEVAEILGISPLLDRRPQALSGGECQRVALGRAMVRRPKVYLFDEPLSSLDAPMRLQLRHEIARLRQIAPTAILYVTHDRSEAFALADRIAILRAGHLEQIGTRDELVQSPANAFVRECMTV
jgi:multiple sugar transport system ATP-binding protein